MKPLLVSIFIAVAATILIMVAREVSMKRGYDVVSRLADAFVPPTPIAAPTPTATV